MTLTRTVRASAALLASILLAAACGGDSTASTTATSVVTTTAGSGTVVPPATNAGGERVVQEGDDISVHYVGTLDDGSEFDSSRERGTTLDFTVGAGDVVDGFDSAVLGMTVGELKTVRIEPADAYGERSDDSILEVPIDQMPDGVKAGDQLTTADGSRQVTVVEVRADVVVVDANHPLAGQALTFEIEMIAIN
ncbi:MAG TPA: FKBP-type peptidyl-prolyl cis-trans isomerase [Acidimicrobiia bacterium]|jgi:FKBP-type peptidyl-prolyl cis-trans isomerase 2